MRRPSWMQAVRFGVHSVAKSFVMRTSQLWASIRREREKLWLHFAVKEMRSLALLSMLSEALHVMDIGSFVHVVRRPSSKMEEAIKCGAVAVTDSVGRQPKWWNHAEGYTGTNTASTHGATLVVGVRQSRHSSW